MRKQRADPQDALGIKAVDRFVEQQYLRVAEQRGRDAEALPHAERKRARPLAADRTEADELEHLGDATTRDAVALRDAQQVVVAAAAAVHRLRVEQRTDLKQRTPDLAVRTAVDAR